VQKPYDEILPLENKGTRNPMLETITAISSSVISKKENEKK
jgi:hypothetical protein